MPGHTCDNQSIESVMNQIRLLVGGGNTNEPLKYDLRGLTLALPDITSKLGQRLVGDDGKCRDVYTGSDRRDSHCNMGLKVLQDGITLENVDTRAYSMSKDVRGNRKIYYVRYYV
jgi:hypothetical protein